MTWSRCRRCCCGQSPCHHLLNVSPVCCWYLGQTIRFRLLHDILYQLLVQLYQLYAVFLFMYSFNHNFFGIRLLFKIENNKLRGIFFFGWKRLIERNGADEDEADKIELFVWVFLVLFWLNSNFFFFSERSEKIVFHISYSISMCIDAFFVFENHFSLFSVFFFFFLIFGWQMDWNSHLVGKLVVISKKEIIIKHPSWLLDFISQNCHWFVAFRIGLLICFKYVFFFQILKIINNKTKEFQLAIWEWDFVNCDLIVYFVCLFDSIVLLISILIQTNKEKTDIIKYLSNSGFSKLLNDKLPYKHM